eukprot:765032-Hanusia_phi.AAC.3
MSPASDSLFLVVALLPSTSPQSSSHRDPKGELPEEAMSAARLSPARPKTAYLGTPRQTTPRLGAGGGSEERRGG